MADNHPGEGSSSSKASGENSESNVQLNVKTLDSQIYSFCVDKNNTVGSLKEKIANEVGLPVGQQRLIFRGKVLKDDDLLSVYHVENGHTLHLVARQQSQPSAGTSSAETNGNNNTRGNDANAAGPRRFGQISHSVVLGTLNVGDQGEGTGSDLNRVIGAVLNSFGIGNQSAVGGMGGTQPTVLFSAPGQGPQGMQTEGANHNVAGLSQEQSQTQSGQMSHSQQFPTMPQFMQIPLGGAAVPIPSMNSPIPDSLNTLSEFMNRMQLTLSQNGNESNSSRDLPSVELPVNSLGLHTPGALSIVLRHAGQLLSDHIIGSLSRTAGRLEQEGASTDSSVRGQIQTESMQLGLVMQHLGALFLELGRTIMTLRLGQAPAQSFVNAGPAVYISPRGPNPIMVQPFPLQTSSLFGASTSPSNIGASGPVGIGNIPRHVNIHIHAGTPLAPIVSAAGARAQNGDGMPGARANGSSSGNAEPAGSQPVRNNVAAAIPTHPAIFATSGAAQPSGLASSLSTANSSESSPAVADLNSLGFLVNNMLGGNQTSSGQHQSSVAQNSSIGAGVVLGSRDNQHNGMEAKADVGGVSGVNDASSRSVAGSTIYTSEETTQNLDHTSDQAFRSDERQGVPTEQEQASVPLGLGLGGLQPKRKAKQPKSQTAGGAGSSAANQIQLTTARGLQPLQSDNSVSNRTGTIGRQGAAGQIDPGSIMSEVIRSPALDGLLAGVSQQTGVGSPDALRNMLEQFSQMPVMRNAFNQIAQQVDSQDPGNVLSGMGGGQGGGIDLSRMLQQMMPIVSQALSGGSALQEPPLGVNSEPEQQYNERALSTDDRHNHDSQINLQQLAQSIQHQDPPRNIFRGMVENTVHLYGNGSGPVDLVDELSSDAELAGEFVEMLRSSLARRLGGESGTAGQS